MWNRFRRSNAVQTAAASYFAFASNAVCAFLTIPSAVRYLNAHEIGLWVVVSQIAAYLLWMDLGIGDGLGRKIAPAIHEQDDLEASRWWSTSLIVLGAQALLLLVLAWLALPLILSSLKISPELRDEANWLLGGTCAVAALALPSRIYPGILMAQRRYHWVPIIQSLIPWVQLGVFLGLLMEGCGVRSYLWAMFASQLAGWTGFLYLVHVAGPARLRWVNGAFDWGRSRELLGFSSAISALGIASAIVASLPPIILGRASGLASIPVFGFTQRAPALSGVLAFRLAHSFFPGLQKMYVAGRLEEFRRRFLDVTDLSLLVGLMGAGGVLAFNRVLMDYIAEDFYFAGPVTNTWFAAGVVILPLASCLAGLLQLSGVMGKIGWIALFQVIAGILAGWYFHVVAGVEGLAASLILLPLVTTVPYAVYRGARTCGWDPAGFAARLGARVAAAVTIVLAAGYALATADPGEPLWSFFGRTWPAPAMAELGTGSLLAVVGAFGIWRIFPRFAPRTGATAA